LSAEGATVVVHYGGHEDAAKQVVQNIESHNGKAIAMQADLSQSQQVTALFDRTEQQFGAPDILVNLAGVRSIGAIADMDDDAFDKMFDLNTKGAFFCMREAARRLNNNGRIVNISVWWCVRPQATQANGGYV
jgi:3-oxoacyl-[acyl-carrier protein] reductase